MLSGALRCWLWFVERRVRGRKRRARDGTLDGTGPAHRASRFAGPVTPIPDGVALVAATNRGLCAVRLGEDPETLAAKLGTEFPGAILSRDDAGLDYMASIVADLAVGRRRPEADTLPLDVQATAFRRRVWEALRRIPAGETRSYAQIAAAVGAPGAARAVGSACAVNPVAVVVPCHRVVGSDGSLHGYAYGLARKRQLLDAEAGAATTGSTGNPPVQPRRQKRGRSGTADRLRLFAARTSTQRACDTRPA